MWVRAQAASSKGTVSAASNKSTVGGTDTVPSRFGDESKQGEIVAGRPCGLVALLARVLAWFARVPVRPCTFSYPVTFGG